MKPHPRPPIIRKTIKWGGAAVTVLLVASWILSVWWCVSWSNSRRGFVTIGGGGFDVMYHQPNTPIDHGQWRWDPVADDAPFRWWFSAYNLGGWSRFSLISIPLWFPIVVAGTASSLAWRLDSMARRRARINLCPKCHYDRAGLAKGAVCPECGSKWGPA
jgi:hypothetical protein